MALCKLQESGVSMPNRIIKESICTSENIDQLSAFQETFFYRLIVNCDDYGLMDARPKILAARLFPLKDLRSNQIEDALRALTSAELVTLYEVDGKPFLQMNTWDRHQQVRATKSKYPKPDDIGCNQLISDDSKCPRNPIQSNIESNPNPIRKSESQRRFTPPTLEEVTAYCKERNNSVNPQKFMDFYESKGWKVGNQSMKDWKACVRTWEQRESTSARIPEKTVSAQQYEQREYTSAQDEARKRMLAMMNGEAG